MPSTIPLSATVEWARKMNFGRRSSLGNSLEPTITSANTVMQAMVGPPFIWPWNRNVVSSTVCVIGQQDYTVAYPDYGWVENASVQDPSTNKWWPLENKVSLMLDSNPGRPKNIAAQNDDGSGNILFRLMPVPDALYSLSIGVQKKAVLFTSVNQTWSPIPDQYSYIYNWGFLSMMWMFADDARFTVANQKFIAHLLGAAQGLTATQINIFLNNWMALTGQPIEKAAMLSQGTQARGV